VTHTEPAAPVLMATLFPTPGKLVDALHERDQTARAHLHERLREPLARLLEQLLRRHRLEHDPGRLVTYGLHFVETFLRTRPRSEIGGLSWNAFRGMVLMQVARVVMQPFGRAGTAVPPAGDVSAPLPLPECAGYESRGYFRPYERIGDAWFGGDWYGGGRGPDGSLWVIVADITGHGYHAYLLASGLPAVWEQCWRSARPDWQPADLLRSMHHLLESCLPEGIYVECTLARLEPTGTVTVSPAGGSRLLLRRAGAVRPDLVKLRGAWLGLLPPAHNDEHRWQLEAGDELLLGTDGLFDQLGTAELREVAADVPLFDHLEERLRKSLAQASQRDDITMLHLRRRPPSTRNGPGDVPV
jgi:hypothetical protein